MSAGTVTFDADEYLELLDELTDLEKRLRALGSRGFNVSKATQTTVPASREKKEQAMKLDLDISGIDWKRSKKQGGGPADPSDGWAWAFAYAQNGGVLRETLQLLQALGQYGTVIVGDFEISLGGRDGKLLNRKKV